jgi:hypothetical protein
MTETKSCIRRCPLRAFLNTALEMEELDATPVRQHYRVPRLDAGLRTTRVPDHVKWIVCPGCDKGRVVADSASSCSTRCRNRVWRRRHGVVGRRAEQCGWCGSRLIYLPQDRLPGVREYCDDRCASQARLFARARECMTLLKALNSAVRRLQNSRTPSVRAAALVLAHLRDKLTERVEVERVGRVKVFLSKLPPAG